jgi:tetratricopeptide (TPR) repeat protein
MSGAAVTLAAPDAAGLWQQALAHQARADHAAALPCCAALAAAHPRHVDAVHLQAFCLMQLGRHDEAVPLYHRALALNAGHPAIHYNLGVALGRLGMDDAALASFDRALALQPGHARAHNNRGTTLRRLTRPAEALAAFDRALDCDPHYGEAHSNRGTALQDLDRLDAALDSLDVAIALLPDAAEPRLNRGNVLMALGRAQEALADYDRAAALAPSRTMAHAARGNALTALNRLPEALAAYDGALRLDPVDANARWNKALAALLAGDFATGLALYESRTGKQASQGLRVHFQPEWTGREDIAGRTLFAYWEQGLGDTLQFCRFAKLAAARGARVVLSVQEPLRPLLRQLGPGVEVIGPRDLPDAFDFHIALMSLPRALGLADSATPAVPASLRAPAPAVERWAGLLGAQRLPRIGLAWAGNALHRNDRHRSMPLAELAKLAGVAAEWVALHKEFRHADRHALAAWPDLRVLAGPLGDFVDTAGAIANLDLVLTVDTSIAHLAAAMGVPTWIMLPFSPDWRWMLDRADSPWYPSVRLFRQTKPGDWAGVVEAVMAALQERLRG